MKTLISILLLMSGSLYGGENFPATPTENHAQVIHGTKVPDPYRWMENLESENLQNWLKSQEALFDKTLAGKPLRDRLAARIEAASSFPFNSFPYEARNGRVFWSRRGEGENQSQLMVREPDGKERVLLDKKALFTNKDQRLTSFYPSPGGRYVLYKISEGQSRVGTMFLYDITSKRLLGEPMTRFINSGRVGWMQDDTGYFFEKLDGVWDESGNQLLEMKNARVMYRSVGGEERLIYEEPQSPTVLFGCQVSEDGRFLVLTRSYGSNAENALLLKPLKGEGDVREWLPNDAAYTWVHLRGDDAFVLTNRDASRGRLIRVSIKDSKKVVPVIEEGEGTMQAVTPLANGFLVRYAVDARVELRLYDLEGKFRKEVTLPFLGMTWSMGGMAKADDHCYYYLNNLFHPGAAFRLSTSGESTPFVDPQLPFDPEKFVLRQVFFAAEDGTRVPMFLAHRRDLDLSRPNPTWLYAYGAYAWSAFPWYQPHIAVWMEEGGIYAMPGIRGGGEYGNAWHQAGIRTNKQTGIDDYLAAADWLVEQKLTDTDLLVANGGSASGLLPAVAVHQAPEKFALAVIDIPTLDLIRFTEDPAGKYRVPEYGDPANAEEFKTLHQLSPYHAMIEEGPRLPILVTAGEKDQIAVPWHAYKFVAAGQAKADASKPVYLQLVRGAGHTYGLTPKQQAKTTAEQITWILSHLNQEPTH